MDQTSFLYLDTKVRGTNITFANAAYNKDFHTRNILRRRLRTVEANLYLNSYGFFRALVSEILPRSKIEIKLSMESDPTMIHSNVANQAKYHIDHISLHVPKINLKPQEIKTFADKYLKAREFTYFKEHIVQINNMSAQKNKLNLKHYIYGIFRSCHEYIYF